MKYWPCRGQNFTSRVHFTQTPSNLWHPPFGWSGKKGQELNRQRENTVLSFPQSWSVCSEFLVVLHRQSGQFHACMILKSHEPWLKPITLKGKTFKNEKIIVDHEYKAKHFSSISDCQRKKQFLKKSSFVYKLRQWSHPNMPMFKVVSEFTVSLWVMLGGRKLWQECSYEFTFSDLALINLTGFCHIGLKIWNSIRFIDREIFYKEWITDLHADEWLCCSYEHNLFMTNLLESMLYFLELRRMYLACESLIDTSFPSPFLLN